MAKSRCLTSRASRAFTSSSRASPMPIPTPWRTWYAPRRWSISSSTCCTWTATICAASTYPSGGACSKRWSRPADVLRISEAFPGAGEAMLDAAREHDLEGIVAKHATSCYESRRSREWLKIKLVNEQEFVIGGFTQPQGSRDHFGALVLGVYEDGEAAMGRQRGNRLRSADRWRRCMRGLQPLVTPRSAPSPTAPARRGITWVKPELVCQVKFANWTTDRRLRAPVFLGLRNDKPAADVEREAPGRCGPPAELLTAGRQGSHAPDRRPRSQVHQPRQGLLSRRRLHQARRAQLLRRRGGADPAASEGPPAFAQALSRRHREGVLFPEERARGLRAVAAHRNDRLRARRPAHQLCLRAGPRQPALPGQPGLHRPEPVDEPLAAPGKSRFRADRSGPAGVLLR